MAFIEKITGFFQDKRLKILDLRLRMSERIGGLTDAEKRRLVLALTAGFSVILTLSVVVSLARAAPKQPKEAEKTGVRIPIPVEEIFLPKEPDFVPGVLLEREQRESWSEEDAAVFWKDPLVHGEEPWRERIEASIDEYLERVP